MWYRVQVKRHSFSAWEDIHGGMDLDWAFAVAAKAKTDRMLAVRVIDGGVRAVFSC